MRAYCQIIGLSVSKSSSPSDKIIGTSFLCFMRSTNQWNLESSVSNNILFFLDFHLSSWPGPLLYLLMLTPHSEPVDVHRDGDHNFGISHRFSRPVVDVARFDPFPLGPTVLKPDLHLHLAQFECVCDLGAFSQRKVFFTVKLLFEFE